MSANDSILAIVADPGAGAPAAPAERKRCVLMMPSEIITIETAKLLAGKGDDTIRDWCRDDGIGRQAKRGPGSHLQISAPALMMRAEGELETLELFRSGERDHPDVKHFLSKSIAWLEAVRLNSKLAKPSRL